MEFGMPRRHHLRSRLFAWIADIWTGRVVINDSFEDVISLTEAAELCFQRCVAWFGLPDDANWPMRVVEGTVGALSRIERDKRYAIIVWRCVRNPVQRVQVVAHEVYHRVTCLRDGLRRELWVDEMLAVLTANRLMEELGHSDYVRHVLRVAGTRNVPFDVDRLKRSKRKGFLFGLRRRIYPHGFGDDVLLLGTRLEAMVGWNHVCRLASSRSWEEWLASVPVEKAHLVCELLHIETSMARRS